VAGRMSVAALEARLRGLADTVDKVGQDARDLAESDHEASLKTQRLVESGRMTKAPNADSEAGIAAGRIGPTAARLAAQLAPGLASEPPDAPGWRSREYVGTGVAPYVRLGTLEPTTGPREVPIVVPLLGTNGWQILADTPSSGHRLVQSLALRLVATAPPFRIRVDSFDPRLTGAMGLLRQVTSKYPQIVPRSANTVDQFRDVLSSLVELSSERAGRMAQLGYKRFEQLLDSGSAVKEPFRVVALFDYPSGIDDATQRDLLRLAATAADRGIVFLVHADQTIAPAPGVRPEQLVGHLSQVQVTGESAIVSHFPGLAVRLDPPFDAATTSAVVDIVNDLADGAVLPTVDFATTLPDESEWWQPARDELSTIIGYDDRTPARLRLRTGNPALPHILIGGAAGQGKSNLLLVMIHGLAVRYAPRDLEMYLLDFKHGVEFAGLGHAHGRPHWLPHIKVLGVHSDRAFGLAVLRHLSAELTRRSTFFKERGNVTDLAQLANDPERPPRILVVLDEFQVLMEDDDDIADEAVRLIEKLMRQGRAYGVHLVLATQTIEGMSGIAYRRDSIFGQVPYRIALKSTQSDSQSVLRSGNTAAADLQFRGEAILNANFGSPEDNQRVLVSFAPPDTLADLRKKLHARARAAGPVEPPRVFHLGEPADLGDALTARPPATGSVVEAWAGLPIAVDETPRPVQVRQDPGSGVIVLGDGALDAIGVLSGLAVSAAAQQPRRPRFVILDGTAADRSTSESKAALVQSLIGIGCDVELVDQPEKILAKLHELREVIDGGAGIDLTYVLGIGMHLVPRMKAEIDFGPCAAESLAEIMSDGPSVGVVTFAWWNRLHVCDDHLGWERSNVSAYAFLRHPVDGVRTVCGPLVSWASEPNRALLWDGISPEPVTVVPFAPLGQGDVDRVVAAVGR
jgi:S-DNA-T family DNA segregation ATPase FtsK/SpoIIIE